MRRLRPLILGTGAAVLGSLAAGAAAEAALPWADCAPSGFQCATLAVPLDRSGALPGTVMLAATRAPALAGPATTAVVALAGGPGQAALPIASSFRRVLVPLLGAADLLVYDQRGTGRSGSLRCAALTAPRGSLSSVVRRCAGQIGPARADFTTAQSVDDLEALRVAGGYAKLVLYGVSYGTKVALAYAAAHPATTQALILDSVVAPEGPDALRRSTFAAVPRVVGQELCGDGACSSITPSAVTDLRRLAVRLGRRSIRGPVLDADGRRRTARLTADGLVSILVAGDLDPTLRAELPGSVRAALTGDVRPILRLSARSSGLENRAAYQQAAADSDALFFVTACEENTTFPWTRGAPEAQRRREAVATVRAAPAALFGIFPREVALGGLPSLCVGYPVAGPAPGPAPALPDVPVLILDGRSDLRTPIEDATAVGRRFARAQVVTVPHTGHSVLGSESGRCAFDAIRAFASGARAADCAATADPFAPTRRPPASLRRVATVRGFSPKVGRTLNAVAQTLTDARRQVIGALLGKGRLPRAVGGLRHGSVRVRSLTRLTLRGYEYVPGVRVSGTLVQGGSTRVTVSGRAAAKGSLTFRPDGPVSGRLGGRRVQATGARAAAAGAARGDGLPSPAQALARGRLVAASR